MKEASLDPRDRYSQNINSLGKNRRKMVMVLMKLNRCRKNQSNHSSNFIHPDRRLNVGRDDRFHHYVDNDQPTFNIIPNYPNSNSINISRPPPVTDPVNRIDGIHQLLNTYSVVKDRLRQSY